MTENAVSSSTVEGKQALADAEGTETPPEAPEGSNPEAETFSREYVEQLRTEARDHRIKAADRDELAQRLHVALVGAAGVLQDPKDLAYNEVHLSDPQKLAADLDLLVQSKPWLAKARGHIHQGEHSSAPEQVSLSALLRG